MRHYRSLNEVSLQHSHLTIGVFDGVHRGHREIIQLVAADSPSVVMTFTPHPANVLSGHEIKCLTTPDERAELLGALGVDVVITEPFTRELAAVSAYEFMARLKRHLGLERLLIGYDFALGRGREGNAARLTEIGQELGFTVEVVPAVGDESGVISSTEIRKLVSLGDVAAAADLLGHPYQIGGPVIHGDHRGRTIGFPTANIEYPARKVLPANGIYACWAWLGNERTPAAINVGLRPTVKADQAVPNVEAYLLDFDRDIYGQFLKLEFVARLRDELKFDSLEALIEQMRGDVEKTRQILASNDS
ncbi:MAG: bifunctional riboflavin kinase/FAD synthetase [Chloroflexi bacterium]|nr:bifunctional riboflavin kinase/FAD synthetase [Chloroflexota bacterium]